MHLPEAVLVVGVSRNAKESVLGDSIAKRWWILHRFGLTPGKLIRRAVNRTEPKILCVCVPKAGTHLLERALCLYPPLYRKLVRTVGARKLRSESEVMELLTGLGPGQILIAHLAYTPEREAAVQKCNIKTVFMIRDPRDVALSEHFFIRTTENHYLHGLFAAQESLNACLRLTITGHEPSGYLSIADRLGQYTGWFDTDTLVLRFEDLVGPAGGGTLERQLVALRALYTHLGIYLGESRLEDLAVRVFSPVSPTFREGRRGDWVEGLPADAQTLFKEIAGQTLIDYGYETGSDW